MKLDLGGVLTGAALLTAAAVALASPEDDRAGVAALDTQYQAAVKRNDAETMGRILADDFVLVLGNGKTYTREDLLESAPAGKIVYERQDEDEGTQIVRVWGDTAVVTARLWLKGVNEGATFERRLWFSDTYVRTPTGWRYAFGQASLPLPATPPTAEPKPVSIAVLPFVNMSDDKANDYFSDGVSEELINLLSKVQGLRVVARTSSFAFKGKDVTIAEVAKALGVDHVLEGSVRKSGDKVRITALLVRTAGSSHSHLWSETYDRTLEDVFAVQDEISDHVVEALKVRLLGTQTARPEINATDKSGSL